MHMESSKVRKLTVEACETPNNLFSHQSDTGLVSSAATAAEHSEKRDSTGNHTSFSSDKVTDNTCEGVNPLLKRTKIPPSANDERDNEAIDAASGITRSGFQKKSLFSNFLHPRIRKRFHSAFQPSEGHLGGTNSIVSIYTLIRTLFS